MDIQPTALDGTFIIEPAPIHDERGFFARMYSEDLFAERGLITRFPQCNVSFNHEAGTLRGMHWQAAPHGEVKLIRCTAGAIYDVLVDIRKDSPSYGRWVGVELSADNRRLFYAPAGVAHGFITLTDNAEVFYQMGEVYVPGAGRGFRWNDPRFAIEWPREPAVINARDRDYPDFDPDAE